jgi:hypothetical protein
MSKANRKNPQHNYNTPIKKYQKIFCPNCERHCSQIETGFQNCVLTLLADELAKIQQVMQEKDR